jgi:hypothetical protein
LERLLLLFVNAALVASAMGVDDEAKVGARLDRVPERRFPSSAWVLDVTKAPYFAKGDGVTDDTAALRRAILDANGKHKVVFLPNGTYLVSETLEWSNRDPNGRPNWGFTWIQGQHPAKTVIRLKDGVFTDPMKPKAIMWCGGFGSADWFHNHVQGVTFNVGRRNAGGTGLQFYSNNYGAVRDCRIVSEDGAGAVGLDLGHRDMNGPLLVRNVEIEGFRIGIATALAVNSQTIEHVTLRGQSEFGLDNHGQALAVRGLRSESAVPAVRTYGLISLLDSTLTGRGDAEKVPALLNYNGGRIHLRDVTTSGYSRAIADVTTPDIGAAYRVSGEDKPGSLGPNVDEYFSHAATSPFGGPIRSLRLPVAEPPVIPEDDPSTWAVAEKFGADPTGQRDSSAAVQKAIDSGASTVFLPGFTVLKRPVRLRGKVRRILGSGGWINEGSRSKPDLIIEKGDAPAVAIEHFNSINGGVEVRSTRTVVFRSVGIGSVPIFEPADLFFEDVTTHDLRIPPGQNVWARQLNVENEGTHVTNTGGTFWTLGYKTERGGTLLHTRKGGRSEVFGTFSYTTTKGGLAPMFVTEDASAFAFFREICFNNDPFQVLVRERRGKAVKTVRRGEGDTTPYVGLAAE